MRFPNCLLVVESIFGAFVRCSWYRCSAILSLPEGHAPEVSISVFWMPQRRSGGNKFERIIGLGERGAGCGGLGEGGGSALGVSFALPVSLWTSCVSHTRPGGVEDLTRFLAN